MGALAFSFLLNTMSHNVGCMRRFALTIFKITTELDSKLSYTPCYV